MGVDSKVRLMDTDDSESRGMSLAEETLPEYQRIPWDKMERVQALPETWLTLDTHVFSGSVHYYVWNKTYLYLKEHHEWPDFHDLFPALLIESHLEQWSLPLSPSVSIPVIRAMDQNGRENPCILEIDETLAHEPYTGNLLRDQTIPLKEFESIQLNGWIIKPITIEPIQDSQNGEGSCNVELEKEVGNQKLKLRVDSVSHAIACEYVLQTEKGEQKIHFSIDKDGNLDVASFIIADDTYIQFNQDGTILCTQKGDQTIGDYDAETTTAVVEKALGEKIGTREFPFDPVLTVEKIIGAMNDSQYNINSLSQVIGTYVSA